MLVLSRKVGESFVIGDDITITVLQIWSNGIRLGIDATGVHEIVRGELQTQLPRQVQPEQTGINEPTQARRSE